MNISLAPEVLFTLGSISITNTLLTGLVITILVAIFSFVYGKRLKYRNPSKFQSILEIAVEGLYGLVLGVMQPKHAKATFGFLMTFFIFILASNWFGLLPIVPAISIEHTEEHIEDDNHSEAVEPGHSTDEEMQKDYSEDKQSLWQCIKTTHCYITTSGFREFHDSTHVLRAPTSDLSMAIALALISVFATNAIGYSAHRFSYFKKYIYVSWPLKPIKIFVGLLEIVSEMGKIVSFSFRLFGNIFAGEILLIVITFISLGLATLPFLMLEIFVGVIQAFVFFMLTAVFVGLALGNQEH